MHDARRGRKVAKHCVFPMICGFGRSESRLAKAAGAEPSGQTRDKKLHAVVARSTFPSQNVQNTSASDHFWKLRCRKSARRCGAEHISKSICTKHTTFGPLLEVEMSKKCTPLWRGAHFEVKMYKAHHGRSTFGSWDVEKVHAVVARSTFRSQNVQNTPWSDHFWKLRCRKSACRCGAKHISKWKCITHHMFKTLGVRTTFGGSDVLSRGRRKGLWTLSKVSKAWGFCSIFNYNHHCTTLHSNTPTLHYIPLHSTTVTYTTLQSITFNYTQLHYTTLHYSTLHYTTSHDTTFHYNTLHYTTLHYTPLHYTTLHSTTQNYTTLYCITLHYHTPLHCTTLHYTTFHYTTLHYVPLHYTTLH